MRFISQGPEHAYFNMALDEAIIESVRQGYSPPTLRLYQWNNPSVSIGHFQRIADINLDYCNAKGYPVVRRLTGGRAVLHDSELTYSISSLTDFPPLNGTLFESYIVISTALIRALKSLGIDARISLTKKRYTIYRNPACFKSASYGEITVGNKKIVGSAQKRYKNGFLQHGSILFDFNPDKLCKVLKNIDSADFKEIGSLSDYVTGISFNDLKNALKEAFEKELKLKLISGTPTKYELELAKELELKKYSTHEWIRKR
jgi:lipoate-protein ligase A